MRSAQAGFGFLSGRPLGFYDPLREIADSLSAVGLNALNGGLGIFNKLPDLRPPAEAILGPQTKQIASAYTGAKGQDGTTKEKSSKKGAEKGSLFAKIAGAAAALLGNKPPVGPAADDDDEEDWLFLAPHSPTVSFGSLHSKNLNSLGL